MRALREGRASGNVRRACLRVNHHVVPRHEACATGIARAVAFFYGDWGATPPNGHGGKRWREASEGSPDWEKARTMRALREGRASGNVRRACLKGEPARHSVPRGMRHRRRHSV